MATPTGITPRVAGVGIARDRPIASAVMDDPTAAGSSSDEPRGEDAVPDTDETPSDGGTDEPVGPIDREGPDATDSVEIAPEALPEAVDTTKLPPARLPSAAPSAPARALAFGSILIAGLCGGLIGFAFTDLQCDDGCTGWAGIGAVIGAFVGAAGVGIVAVLVLRAMDEWNSVQERHPERHPGRTPGSEP